MKTGFVAFIGRPNVGKSSLLNAILDYKVAITSDKPQTTRDQIKGIFNDENSQIVFIDTPGIHKPKQLLGESLNQKSYSSLKGIDLALFLQPADELIGPGDKKVISNLPSNKIAVITKLDKSKREVILKKVDELKSLGFKEVVATSIHNKNSIESIIDFIKEKMDDGEPMYDREHITDRSMRFLAKEIIRESAIKYTRNEVPHSIGIVIDEFSEEDPEMYKIFATLYVERESQKGILVGHDGAMIKTISTAARKKIAYNFNHKTFLKVRIKVKKNWTNKPEEIIKMGY